MQNVARFAPNVSCKFSPLWKILFRNQLSTLSLGQACRPSAFLILCQLPHFFIVNHQCIDFIMIHGYGKVIHSVRKGTFLQFPKANAAVPFGCNTVNWRIYRGIISR